MAPCFMPFPLLHTTTHQALPLNFAWPALPFMKRVFLTFNQTESWRSAVSLLFFFCKNLQYIFIFFWSGLYMNSVFSYGFNGCNHNFLLSKYQILFILDRTLLEDPRERKMSRIFKFNFDFKSKQTPTVFLSLLFC